jgi:hypothetical protein
MSTVAWARISLYGAALIGATMLVSPLPANAQAAQCAKRIDIIKHLTGQYQEAPVAIGLADNGSLLEILASTDGKTWTLLFSMPTGVSCLMATGQDWQSLPRMAEVGPPA